MSPGRPYQDMWRGGELVQKGRRACSERYQLIRRALGERLPQGFSVLDVGAWNGYFSRRLEEDLGARCTLWDRREPPDLEGTGLRYVQGEVTGSSAGEVEPHDVVLLVSVLHHLADWKEVLDALLAHCHLAVLELAVPEERAHIRGVPAAAQVVPEQWAEYMEHEPRALLLGATTGTHGLPRPLLLVRGRAGGPAEPLEAWGRVRPGLGLSGRWMREVAVDAWQPLGYVPEAGTLNVELGREAKARFSNLSPVPGERLGPARLKPKHLRPVLIGGRIAGHLRLNLADTGAELLAPVQLRSELGLEDGQLLLLEPR
jgi:hypothetical protein